MRVLRRGVAAKTLQEQILLKTSQDALHKGQTLSRKKGRSATVCATPAPNSCLCVIDGVHALLLNPSVFVPPLSFYSSLVSSYSVLTVSYHLIKSIPLHRLVHWTFCLSPPHHCNDSDC